MDDHEKTMLEYNYKISQLFREYMTRVTVIDELTGSGCHFLRGFQHELETFRKQKTNSFSEDVKGIIEAHCTRRTSAYVEAGYRLDHANKNNIRKLNSYEEALREHMIKVRMLINELENLSEDVIGIVKEFNQSTDSFFDNYNVTQDQQILCQMNGQSRHDEMEVAESIIEERDSINCVCQRTLHYAIMMRMMSNMLRKDYEMQVKIILSLSLSTSSDKLNSYCCLWELRPFVDDKFLQQCWKFI